MGHRAAPGRHAAGVGRGRGVRRAAALAMGGRRERRPERPGTGGRARLRGTPGPGGPRAAAGLGLGARAAVSRPARPRRSAAARCHSPGCPRYSSVAIRRIAAVPGAEVLPPDAVVPDVHEPVVVEVPRMGVGVAGGRDGRRVGVTVGSAGRRRTRRGAQATVMSVTNVAPPVMLPTSVAAPLLRLML